MRKGEDWRIRFPTVPGRTQAGKRSAVIVQNEPFLSALPTVLVVPFTSKLAAARFGGTMMVQPDVQNGLTLPSVALVFQLSAQDRRNLVDRMGELESSALSQLIAMIQQLTA